ncbi:hypothetical protein AMECASPLE_017307 [Ameca splendens]|uniref:RRM domain-containing protein n=1 Tax=Ameca splendens TaxID=208324 RepID=A0ABV0XFH9_9TELE
MDFPKPRTATQTVPSLKLSNGYILPEGRLTPNALFVGGIDMKVDENEMRDFFARYGNVKEVKIITYRGGVCKGYGFVYFNEDVDIQSIIEQQISFKGRKLKLGPAIMKQRSPRSVPSRLVGPSPWMNPSQYIYCACCSPVGGGVTQVSPVFSGGSAYNQPYSYSSFGGGIVPQMLTSYSENPYPYQYTPAPWTPDQRTRPINQTFLLSHLQDAGCRSFNKSGCRQGDILAFWTSESTPTPQIVFRTPSPLLRLKFFRAVLTPDCMSVPLKLNHFDPSHFNQDW